MPRSADPTIYIVEDEADLRASLVFQLEAAGFVAKAYADAETFLAACDPEAEGCVIVDVHLPGLSGLALLEKLVGSGLAVIVVTGLADVAMAVQAMRMGATDFIEKPFAPGAVTHAVRQALDRAAGTHVLRREADALARRIATLTAREREVFDGLVSGKLGKQVAIDLGISPRTVEIHRARIAEKLGARSASELLRMGLLAQVLQVTTAARR